MTTPYGFSSPKFQGDFQNILEAYRETEETLASLVASAAKRHAQGTAKFYANQQRIVWQLMRKAEKALEELDKAVTPKMVQLVLAEYEAAIHSTRAYDHAAIPQGVAAAGTQSIMTEMVSATRQSHQSILRNILDSYREVQRAAAIESMATGQARIGRIQSTLNKFADRGIKGFTDRAGRSWGMDTYAEMIVRTAVNRAGNEGRIHGFRQNGVNLVIASSHKACAPQCLPYQGRVLSLDGTSGPVVIDIPGGGTETVHVVASLQEAIKNGYHHVNCRHTESAYIPGMKIPEPIETDREDYELSQRQRYIERQIRRWKLREKTAFNARQVNDARAKVMEWQKTQREHVKQADWMRRRYDREKIIRANNA